MKASNEHESLQVRMSHYIFSRDIFTFLNPSTQACSVCVFLSPAAHTGGWRRLYGMYARCLGLSVPQPVCSQVSRQHTCGPST